MTQNSVEARGFAAQPDHTTLRKRWGLHTSSSLRVRSRELGSPHLVRGLLPTRSINILVGDSGLGKSPLVYQAGICVATGVPFLGHETQKGSVVIADFENGIEDINGLVEQIGRYLGLTEPVGKNLSLWTVSDCPTDYGRPGHTLLDMLQAVGPAFAIIDSVGPCRPEAEEKNSDATRMLQEFRRVARECGTAVLLVHHRRKQPRKADESAGPLETANLRQWLQDTRGASSLINGTDIRLGVDEADLSALSKDDVALVLRGLGRMRGEIGPLYLARDLNENGDPVGYRRLIGSELLFSDDQRNALAILSQQFTFKDAKFAYKRADQATANFLRHCANLGLVQKLGRGRYEKMPPQNRESDGACREKS